MTNTKAPLSDVIAFITEQLATIPSLDSSSMEAWTSTRAAVHEAEERVQGAITERFSARFTTQSGGTAVSIQGIRATSTMGMGAALQNWMAGAEKRIAQSGEGSHD